MDLTVVAYATVALSLFVSVCKISGWMLNADLRAIIHAGRRLLMAALLLAPVVVLYLAMSGRWMSALGLAAVALAVAAGYAPWRRLSLTSVKSVLPRVFGSSGTWTSGRESPSPELVRQSIAVLQAYLERAEIGAVTPRITQCANAEPAAAQAAPTSMSANEALDVLGLDPAASAEEIATAHCRLEGRLKPEFGGTRYLAAKIDEARDVLLGRRRPD